MQVETLNQKFIALQQTKYNSTLFAEHRINQSRKTLTRSQKIIMNYMA